MASKTRVLELYSGIGGMHFALEESGILYDVVQAMDLNLNANKVYQHNFPNTKISGSSIGGLQVEDLDQMRVDMMVMSPPCQPFTRIGNQKDEDDGLQVSDLDQLCVDMMIMSPPCQPFTRIGNQKDEDDGLQVSDLDQMCVDMMVMSPPCQPFTRIGNQKDEDDVRTGSFLHFLNIFKTMSKYPSYLLLENVKGFETSNTRDKLIQTLDECGYTYQEFLLTPKQFGVPNCRLRYFLLAKLKPLKFGFTTTAEIMTSLPDIPKEWLPYRLQAEREDCQTEHNEKGQGQKRPSDDLEDKNRLLAEGEDCETEKKEKSILHQCHAKDTPGQVQGEKRLSDDIDEENSTKRVKLNCDSNDVTNISETESSKNDIENEASKCVSEQEISNKKSNGYIDLSNSNANVENKELASSQSVTHIASFQQKPRNCSLKQAAVTRFSLKSDDINNSVSVEGMKKVCEDKPVTSLENCGLTLRLGAEDRDITDGVCLTVGHFLESDWMNVKKFEKFLVPRKLFKHLVPMDIVNYCTRKTTCFTKRYGKFVSGGGSLLLTTSDIGAIEEANRLKERVMEKQDRESWGEKELDIIGELKMRYFTPREVANIMCFPKSFNFPADCTDRQKYMLLGNSINVHVVAVLIKLLTL